ncbi:similar to Saccharomyces cerevisiae YMR154C RIM13 Calpain-like cysteine protease involved in proteolytic activation of Rim101p in response to alkaline pH [Maudiozyma saulgeensis]|uniref:Cysteine protease RIM13 n=1 Tax=Maudiozyma saulgeensis TaxID=1789683 RepID=A0A1X7R0I4_9SACH|nr:similar to Saccharomyces cerevisiae YMR154C RIM13 Calpain-like cysteine protease involved in proteolytic activation of Rim101p in response to alkaline pH [Kazachstania saulgeensis]
MTYEHEINDILKEAYIGKHSTVNAKLLNLLQHTKESNDPILLKQVIWLNEQIKNITDRERVEWLMSVVRDKFYPPLCIDNATSIPWNNIDSSVLKVDQSKTLKEKYPITGSLKETKYFPNEEVVMPDHKIPIEQSADIGDCSLVASIINIRKALLDIPRIKKVSDNCYQVQLHFNGSDKRLVYVESSQIPTKLDGDQLSLKSNSKDDKIIEIACLDINTGSYDTQGSNVVIDTYLMTGFIPEIIPVKNVTFERFSKYFKSNLCLMAIGTSDINKDDPFNKNLLPFHDYVIIEINDITKQVALQDPLDLKLNLKFTFNELFQRSFYQLYMNWDPTKLFKSERRLTFRYDSAEANVLDSIYGKPFFKLTNKSSNNQTVWLFLETHIEQDIKENIAYIQRIPPSSMLSKPFPPNDSVVDIGLQLLKVDIPGTSFMNFFVYSKNNAHFTLHSHSISTAIQLTKPKIQNYISASEFTWNKSDGITAKVSRPMEYLIGGRNFYLNPTFALEIRSDDNEEILFDIQLHSIFTDDILSVQIFNTNDENLLNPILPMSDYPSSMCTKLGVPLMTNIKYKLIFSRYKELTANEKYTVLMYAKRKSDQSNEGLSIDINRIYNEYGGLAYQNKANITFEPTKNRYKLFLTNTDRTNELFIRIKPAEETGKAVRCNVFDGESHECIFHDNNFYKGTFVIPKVPIESDCKSIVLLVELEEIINRNLAYQIFIGSKWKISRDEKGQKI